MYYWNIRRLKEDLVQGITPRQSLHYLIAWLLMPVAMALAAELVALSVSNAIEPTPAIEQLIADARGWSTAFAVSSLAEGAALVAGLAHCYRRNGGSEGRSLLPRLLALAWVSAVRVHGLFVLPLVVLVGVVRAASSMSGTVPTWVWYALSPLTTMVILWRVGVHIGDVSARAAAESR